MYVFCCHICHRVLFIKIFGLLINCQGNGSNVIYGDTQMPPIGYTLDKMVKW